MTEQELIDFEYEIEQLFLAKQIRVPVHFSGGNEKQLISIFSNINNEDWVLSTHRNHYHALLKGVPKEEVKQTILNGNSMHMCFSKYRFITSSIVGGILPIAVGISIGIKINNGSNKVYAFVGDMASEMGVFHECIKYSSRNGLPVVFVIEDNGLSVETPTQLCWGELKEAPNIIRYEYERKFPHVGCGVYVTF